MDRIPARVGFNARHVHLSFWCCDAFRHSMIKKKITLYYKIIWNMVILYRVFLGVPHLFFTRRFQSCCMTLMKLTCTEWGGFIIYIIIQWLLLGAGLCLLSMVLKSVRWVLLHPNFSVHLINKLKWPDIVLHTGVPAHFRSLMSMQASRSGNPVGLWRGGGSGPRAVQHHMLACVLK